MEILHHDLLHHNLENNLEIVVPSRSCGVYDYTRCHMINLTAPVDVTTTAKTSATTMAP